MRKYAEYQDMTIAEEFSDEGHSGKNIKSLPLESESTVEVVSLLKKVSNTRERTVDGRCW